MIKLFFFNKSILFPSMVLICFISMNPFAFAQDENFSILKKKFYLDASPEIQSVVDESETISSANASNSPARNITLKSAHKYLGYATAALAGITAATFSTGSSHEIAGYTTAGLSLITTAIGFYEYGEYLDFDEGLTGYNMHMILETAATIGFIVTAALQHEEGAHAVVGGVSTAMMILPIFVVHW